MNAACRMAPLALLLLAAAGSADANPSTLKVTELIRPTAGRPTAAIVSGHLHASDGLFTRTVEIEDGVVVVTLEVERQDVFASDYPYAFAIELPPLPAGTTEVLLKTRAGADAERSEASFSLVVHPAISAGIEPTAGGNYRLWIAGSGAALHFETLPVLAGDRIRARVSAADCDLQACPPPGPFRSTSEEIGAPPAGSYTLEIFDTDASVLLWRSEEEILLGEVLVRGGRFAISLELDPPHAATPRLAMPPTADSALFYFFSPDNWEAMVKVLDGCAINGRFWVFAAASTDVGYTLRITDTASSSVKEYRHEAGTPAPAIADIEAFSCEDPS